MKVHELIIFLNDQPQEAEVYIFNTETHRIMRTTDTTPADDNDDHVVIWGAEQ